MYRSCKESQPMCTRECGKPAKIHMDRHGYRAGYYATCGDPVCIKARRTGSAHPNYHPIGARRVTQRGEYVEIKVGEPSTWRAEHLIVMEEYLGRQLAPDEKVHHINMDKMDNRPENLCVLDMASHSRAHGSLLKQVKILMELGVIIFNRGGYHALQK